MNDEEDKCLNCGKTVRIGGNKFKYWFHPISFSGEPSKKCSAVPARGVAIIEEEI